jgi:proline racemase
MALLHHRGRMRVGDAMISEGILGTRFTGRIAAETEVAGRRAIVPEITGTSHLTGTSQFLFDPDDPVREGYLL